MKLSFENWIKYKEGIDPYSGNQGVDLYSAREGIKNGMANMHSDPSRILSSALQSALSQVQGHKQAELIIRNMQNIAMEFFAQIRHLRMDNKMPDQGEQGFEEYQQIYQQYYNQLYQIWQGLDKLAHQ